MAVLRYLFLKEPDTECQVSTEYGTLLIACYHHLSRKAVLKGRMVGRELMYQISSCSPRTAALETRTAESYIAGHTAQR